MTMQASFIAAPGVFELRETAVPELSGQEQAIIRTELSAICGSDLHEIAAPRVTDDVRAPGYPCHESVGTVVASSDDDFPEGTRVLAVPNLTYAAGFAPFQRLPTSSLIRLPEGMPAEEAIFAQQLGTVAFAMKRFWPEGMRRTEAAGTAVVLGAGSAGLNFTNLCRIHGFRRIVVSDLYAHRRAAAERAGATHVAVGGTDEVERLVTDLTDGVGADLVIDAAGQNESRIQTVSCVRVDGRIGLFGVPTTAELTIPFAELFRRKPTVEMCWDAQAEPGLASFREALDLIDGGAVDTAMYNMRFVSLDEVPELLGRVAKPSDGLIKAGVRY